ncbi:MAG: hypothetical protein R3C52_11750 [Hyphomonadaceae bacterium]
MSGKQVVAAVLAGLALAGAGLSPAVAQTALRPAISAELSPEEAARVFETAVVDVCIPAVSRGVRVAQLSASARGNLVVVRDAAARRDVGALPEETVWAPGAARGAVAVRETFGRCVVFTYGPPAAVTLRSLADRLAGREGFERMMTTAGKLGLSQSLFKMAGRRRVQVLIEGSEPGMPGHRSRFSVVTATVMGTPAG